MATEIRTPDAIHGATAILNACGLFVTNDSGFRRVPDMPVTVLNISANSLLYPNE